MAVFFRTPAANDADPLRSGQAPDTGRGFKSLPGASVIEKRSDHQSREAAAEPLRYAISILDYQ